MNKNHGIVRYLEFLVARDGDADLLRRRLSKREAFFDALARSPVSSYALIDRATYFRNMARRRPEPGLEPRMLWILATALQVCSQGFDVIEAEPAQVVMTICARSSNESPSQRRASKGGA